MGGRAPSKADLKKVINDFPSKASWKTKIDLLKANSKASNMKYWFPHLVKGAPKKEAKKTKAVHKRKVAVKPVGRPRKAKPVVSSSESDEETSESDDSDTDSESTTCTEDDDYTSDVEIEPEPCTIDWKHLPKNLNGASTSTSDGSSSPLAANSALQSGNACAPAGIEPHRKSNTDPPS
eukprot:TRINITY_DN5003_c0_g1_i1.p1 TRINITY_DN5003_c0_g1~~TRINITY_DN5003_c0_g1_i1.p1  ORF type:complete len:189 (+),score=40.18 TRINITY_DN5003_c0_g1_i1:32-568(+)